MEVVHGSCSPVGVTKISSTRTLGVDRLVAGHRLSDVQPFPSTQNGCSAVEVTVPSTLDHETPNENQMRTAAKPYRFRTNASAGDTRTQPTTKPVSCSEAPPDPRREPHRPGRPPRSTANSGIGAQTTQTKSCPTSSMSRSVDCEAAPTNRARASSACAARSNSAKRRYAS